MSTLFISDLHLDENRPDITATLIATLEHHVDTTAALYILGDLFEVWLGDDDNSPLIEQVSTALSTWTASGAKLYIQHGNRDFLLGEQFCNNTGAILLGEDTLIELNGEPTLLLHGDSLCTDDVEYQNFRQHIRNPESISDLLAKPLSERRDIASGLRHMSQTANSNKAENIMDVNPQSVAEKMREYGVLRLIHGHTHRPGRHQFKLDGGDAERIVLGDWNQRGWLIQALKSSIELKSFPILSTG